MKGNKQNFYCLKHEYFEKGCSQCESDIQPLEFEMGIKNIKITLDLTHLKQKPFLLVDLKKIVEQHEKRPTEIIMTKKQATYLRNYGQIGYWNDYRGIPLKII